MIKARQGKRFVRLPTICLITLVMGCMDGASAFQAIAREPATTMVTYTPSDTNFANPERGFYHYSETRASAPTPSDLATLRSYREAESITLLYCINYLDEFVESPISATVGLLPTMPPEVYDLLLHLPAPEAALADRPAYAIRLANAGVWEESTGYNRLLHTLLVSTTAAGESYEGVTFFEPVNTTTVAAKFTFLPLITKTGTQ